MLIHFSSSFIINTDTAEGIAQELVQAGLVDERDVIAVASNLQKLIDSYNAQNAPTKNVIFALVSNRSLGKISF